MIPWHIAVLIPARNEEVLLPRCLRSVQRARQMLPPGVTSDVILVADSCTDLSFEVAMPLLTSGGIALRADAGCVGAARVLAANAALARCPVPASQCWLANTDADCEVPDTWLLNQLRIARRGFAAVAGIVDVDSYEGHGDQVPALFRSTYLIRPDGTHPHVHGANIGIRGDAYLAVGGWTHLTTAEDHDLWDRVGLHQFPRLSDATLKILTSGRRVARAPHGFAGALAALNEVSA